MKEICDGAEVRPYLPLEIVFDCYRLLFSPSFFEEGILVDKPPWKDIEGLTLASKASRQIILRLWFRVLRISDTEDWKVVLGPWKRLYHWTRLVQAIHYTSTVYKTPRYLLESFYRLDTLRIDLPTTHVTGEGDFDFAAPEIAQIIHDGIPSTTILHLEIRGITWLDPFVMRHIALGVPNLRTLRLRQPLVWCGLCNTIGAPAFKWAPRRIVYDGGTGLPDGYSRFLAPLQHLHTIVLTAACGEGNIDYNTLFLNGSVRRPSVLHGTSVLRTNEGKSIGWSGECAECMQLLLNDDTFRQTWVSKKAAEHWVHGGDGGSQRGSPRLPSRPPSLRRVEWNLLQFSSQNWPGLLPATSVYDM